MQTHLSKEQEELLALQEKGFYSELSAEEQAVVSSQTTKEAFDHAHLVILESKNCYPIPSVQPLLLPKTDTSLLRRIAVPLSSAAAASILTWLFFTKELVVVKKVNRQVYLTADTVYLHEKTIDTIIEYREGKITYVFKNPVPSPKIELTEQVKSKETLPPLSTFHLKNKGKSMKDDPFDGIMEGVIF